MRHVVITGTNRGLGQAFVDQLAAEPGVRLLALARSFPAEHLEHPQITTRTCDLADPASLPDAAELAKFFVGATEAVLLHNAAVIEPIGEVGALDPDALIRSVAVNLTAPMLLTNAAVAARPHGVPLRILFVSSGAAHHVISGWSAYSATKRGGEEFFAHVTAEGRDDLVSAVSVNPGVIDTGMQAEIRSAEFAERQRFVDRHQRGELRPAAVVAAEILAAHLPPTHSR
ncbi:NAD(P)-dependent dehydrogenase (short-subunit alcohol dehydrogenase family) [Hamadaea flava]|uniref:SDR family NAD(P)-dependent oxidoreductase n=1 Tax=Hamadaea flava TaxID=1742688 RepID=A0ABV8LJ40_9ACTN|nr:SDR family NAD(P)-dependent oxidoreductase [Hamadaea flava]MCP2325098.1 NAD(P)-dependent dehydrogenase (short-subunit alcohol dehydrogenase family) [Hamadaea flava]